MLFRGEELRARPWQERRQVSNDCDELAGGSARADVLLGGVGQIAVMRRAAHLTAGRVRRPADLDDRTTSGFSATRWAPAKCSMISTWLDNHVNEEVQVTQAMYAR